MSNKNITSNAGFNKPTFKALLFWALPAAFLLIFFYQPMVAIFRLIFNSPQGNNLSSINWHEIWRLLGFTLFQATLSTLLTLLLGIPAAHLFSHFDFRGRKFMRLLTALPFILPTVVVAAGFNALLGPRGWVNLLLMGIFGLEQAPVTFLNTFPAILLAHVFYNTTIVIRIVSNAWAGMDRQLTQAAQMLGAKPGRVFREITLPLLLPAIASSTLLVFLFNFTSFGVILMLGGPQFATLEVAIYTQAFHMLNLPMAGMLSIIQLTCTLLITIFHNRLNLVRQGKMRARSQAENTRKPKTVGEKIWVAVLILVLIVLITSPLLGLVLRSFTRLDAERGDRGNIEVGFTLAYYRELFFNRRSSLFYVPPVEAVWNSLRYSFVTVLISTMLGLLVAYALNQGSFLNRLADPLFMMPLGASAVTLGLGFIITFNHPFWTQAKFPLLIPIAHSLVALPFVVRTLLPALQNIPLSLRQAAKMLGASPLQVFREIDLPILLRAMLVSAIFAFTISMGEFGASSFLSTPETPTIPVAIFRYISQPGALNYGQALAMSSILLLTCSSGIWLIEKIRLPGEEVF